MKVHFVLRDGYRLDLASGLTEVQQNCLIIDSTFKILVQQNCLIIDSTLKILDIITRLGYCISMDNFFSSPQLYNMPCDNYTDSVRTFSANRKGVLKEIVSKKLKKGEIAAMYPRSLMVLKWKDKKDVLMLSTFHDDNTKEIED